MDNDKVAIYCRLSVEDIDKTNKEDDSESIQNQKLLLMDYAMKQEWSIHKVYSDDDYSGLDRERPEFNKMITDAKAGMFHIILCKTQSRFTRDMEMVEKYLHGLFVIWGIRFVSVVDNVDTNVKGNKKARQIYGLINEWYCEDASENIKSVFRKKMESGQFLGSYAPYGYMKDPNDHHRLIIDHEAADVVKTIFNLYIEGYGCQQIAHKLTADDIPPPSLYKQRQGLSYKNPNGGKYSQPHGVWANNSISRMLRNKTYIGTLVQGREKKVSYKSKKVVMAPTDEWVVIENNHEPIIEERIFQNVQQLMQSRRQVHKPKMGYTGTAKAHALAGKVRCMDCGTNMTRSAPARNGNHYLRCSLAYKTRTRARACTPHTINLEGLIKMIECKIQIMTEEYLLDDGEREFLKEYCLKQEGLQDERQEKEKELNTLQARLNETSTVLTKVYVDKARGILTEEDFLNIKSIIEQDREKLKSKQALIESQVSEFINKKLSLKNADELLQGYLNFQSLSHQMVNEFIDYIEVSERNEQGEQRVLVHWQY